MPTQQVFYGANRATPTALGSNTAHTHTHLHTNIRTHTHTHSHTHTPTHTHACLHMPARTFLVWTKDTHQGCRDQRPHTIPAEPEEKPHPPPLLFLFTSQLAAQGPLSLCVCVCVC